MLGKDHEVIDYMVSKLRGYINKEEPKPKGKFGRENKTKFIFNHTYIIFHILIPWQLEIVPHICLSPRSQINVFEKKNENVIFFLPLYAM